MKSPINTSSCTSRPLPLKLHNSSHPITKSPVIIHTYSPKIIHTQPAHFMWLVQSLTGSSHTRSRCRRHKPDFRKHIVVVENEINSPQLHDSVKPIVESSSCSIAPTISEELDSIFHDSSCSESYGFTIEEAPNCQQASTKHNISPRGPRLDSSDRDQGFQQFESVPFADPTSTQLNSPSSDFASLISTVNPSYPGSTGSFSNEALFKRYGTSAWDSLDGFISPFKSSHFSFSASGFRQNLTSWTGRDTN